MSSISPKRAELEQKVYLYQDLMSRLEAVKRRKIGEISLAEQINYLMLTLEGGSHLAVMESKRADFLQFKIDVVMDILNLMENPTTHHAQQWLKKNQATTESSYNLWRYNVPYAVLGLVSTTAIVTANIALMLQLELALLTMAMVALPTALLSVAAVPIVGLSIAFSLLLNKSFLDPALEAIESEWNTSISTTPEIVRTINWRHDIAHVADYVSDSVKATAEVSPPTLTSQNTFFAKSTTVEMPEPVETIDLGRPSFLPST